MPDPSPALPREEKLRELAHLFTWLRPYRGRFVAALAASLVSISFGALFPFLVGHLIDASIPSLKLPPADAWRADVNTIALILAGTLAIQAVLTFFSSYAFNK